MDNKRPSSIPSLTGLRFFASVAIFIHHFYPKSDALGAKGFLFDAFHNLTGSGVSLFFALSGFILAYAHQEIATTYKHLVDFWLSRFARIYPVYFLALIWFAPFILFHRYSIESFHLATLKSIFSFLPSLFLVQAWFHPRFAIAWNGPGWTLSVETVFYILFPYLQVKLREQSPSRLIQIATIMLLASCFMSAGIPLINQELSNSNFVAFNPIFHVPTFVFGAALGNYFIRCDREIHGQRYFIVIALCSGVVLTLISPFIPRLVIHNTLFLPCFGVLLLGLASHGYGSFIFNSRYICKLGEASYALYILQFSIAMTYHFVEQGFVIKDYWADMRETSEPLMSDFIILLCISCAVSVFVFDRFETPARRWIKSNFTGWFNKRRLYSQLQS